MILNLTQHEATPAQIAAGVVEPGGSIKATIKATLTFDDLPSSRVICRRAMKIAAFASILTEGAKNCSAMIGGAPYLMPALERALLSVGITPVYAFSTRESVETTLPDGSVKKSQVFRHLGFVKGGVR